MRQNNWWTIFLIFGLFLLWMQTVTILFPPPKPLDKEAVETLKKDEKAPPANAKPEAVPAAIAKSFKPWNPKSWVTLGSADRTSSYHMEVLLDPNGACVRRLILNKFRKSDIYGYQVRDDAGQPATLDLIPLDEPTQAGSFLLYHFPTDSKTEHPLDTLGKAVWTVVPGPNGNPVESLSRPGDFANGIRVTFRTNIKDIRVEKVFTLFEGEYHLGLEVRVSRQDLPGDGKAVPFRYQLTGARGMPIEGAWYTTVFKNSLIGYEDRRGNFDRDYQDGRALSTGLGGYEVEPTDRFIRYAAIAVQYFASAITVDDRVEQDPGIIKRARPTVDVALFRGYFGKLEGNTLRVLDENRSPQTFLLAPNESLRLQAEGFQTGQRIALRYVWEPDYDPGVFRYVAVDFLNPDQCHPLFSDDVVMRVTTNPIELKPGDSVSHRFVLYNGPAKPSQIQYARGQEKVPAALLDWYGEKLKLSTIVDYPSAFGRWFLGLSWVVIFFTNKLHWVLAMMNQLVPSLGLCIIVLTVLVRGAMFPVSRKQAMMSIKMQEMAPELKAIQEKHKGDPQALSKAQMALYRKYNINPLGTCWVLLLQMPIFMGLYFALQESILFRLEPFWPTWIDNLAAPDALFWWGENIPLISRPVDYGSFLYFGPAFNLLPLFAMGFMVLQQKWFMPPPTTEEQEVQQKTTMVMTCVMGLMFYKVAAGMCLYFIASSLWSLAERQLLPKKKLTPSAEPVAETPVKTEVAPAKSENSRRKASRSKETPQLTGFAKKVDDLKKWFEDLQKRASK